MEPNDLSFCLRMSAKVTVIAIFTLLSIQVVYAQKGNWVSLFDGKNLDGWEHVGPGKFVLKDGILKSEGGMGLLWYTKKKFENCVIRVVYKNPGGANSGVFIRIPEKPTEPWMPVNKGYEVQIYEKGDSYHCTGVLYSLTKAMARPAHPDQWNTMEITLKGDTTRVKLNGVLVTDFHEGEPVPPKKETFEPDRGPRPESGYIGLQNHSDEDVVYFKEVSVRPIESLD